MSLSFCHFLKMSLSFGIYILPLPLHHYHHRIIAIAIVIVITLRAGMGLQEVEGGEGEASWDRELLGRKLHQPFLVKKILLIMMADVIMMVMVRGKVFGLQTVLYKPFVNC